MSVRIAPQPVSVAISQQAVFQARTYKSTRVIEGAEKTSGDRQENPQKHKKRNTEDKNNRRPDKPPGKYPSTGPQALFDATLIAAEFKAAAEANERAEETKLARESNEQQLAEAKLQEYFEKKFMEEHRAKTAR